MVHSTTIQNTFLKNVTLYILSDFITEQFLSIDFITMRCRALCWKPRSNMYAHMWAIDFDLLLIWFRNMEKKYMFEMICKERGMLRKQ